MNNYCKVSQCCNKRKVLIDSSKNHSQNNQCNDSQNIKNAEIQIFPAGITYNEIILFDKE